MASRILVSEYRARPLGGHFRSTSPAKPRIHQANYTPPEPVIRAELLACEVTDIIQPERSDAE
jgi:hypothetical protein